jgi:hypothetical protein
MNGKQKQACVFGGLITGLYAIYVGGSVASGAGMPDGAIFGTVAVVVAGIGGYAVGALKNASDIAQEAQKQP